LDAGVSCPACRPYSPLYHVHRKSRAASKPQYLYQLVTLLEISVDQFFYPANGSGESDCRKHIDVLLNSMDERELTIVEATAEGLKKARETVEV